MLSLVLRTRFGLLISGQFLSQIGDAFMRTALLVLMARHFGTSPVGISLILLADLLPSIVLGPYAGVVADRWDRKKVMWLTDVVRGVIVAALFVTLPVHSFVLTFLLVLVLGFTSAFYGPAKSAGIPTLVGEDKIGEAMGMSQSVSSVTQVIGMALGGVSAGVFGIGTSFLIDAASFFASALFTAFLPRLLPPEEATPTGARSGVLAGFDAIREAPVLRFLFVMLLPVTFALGIFTTTQSSILLQYLHLSAPLYGLNEAVFGVGSAIGALIGVRLQKRVKAGTLMNSGVGALGVSFFAILAVVWVKAQGGEEASIAVTLAWSVLLGLLVPIINVPLNTLFLRATPKHVRGRSAALLQGGVNLSTLIGVMAGGLLGAVIGSVALTWGSGLLLLLIVVAVPFARDFRVLQTDAPVQADQSAQQAPGVALPSPVTQWSHELPPVVVDNFEVVRWLRDETVLRILEVCEHEAKTLEEMALQIGLDAADVESWVSRLERNGMLIRSEEQSVRFRSATTYNLTDQTLRSNPAAAEAYIMSYLDEGRRAIADYIYGAEGTVPVSRARISIELKQMTEHEWLANGRRLTPALPHEALVAHHASNQVEPVLVTDDEKDDMHTFVEVTMSYRMPSA